MDIGKNLEASFNLYSKNFGVLLGATLVAAILSAVTLGILAGPLIGGLIILILKLNRGEKAEFNEIFNHFDQLSNTILVTVLIWAAIIVMGVFNFILFFVPIIGWIAIWLINSLVIGPVLGIMCTLVIGLIVDQKFQTQEAFKKAFVIFQSNLLPIWLYSLVFSIIGCIANIPRLQILSILTAPLAAVGMALAYQQLTVETIPTDPPTDNLGTGM